MTLNDTVFSRGKERSKILICGISTTNDMSSKVRPIFSMIKPFTILILVFCVLIPTCNAMVKDRSHPHLSSSASKFGKKAGSAVMKHRSDNRPISSTRTRVDHVPNFESPSATNMLLKERPSLGHKRNIVKRSPNFDDGLPLYVKRLSNIACVVNGGMSHGCDIEELEAAKNRLKFLTALSGPGKKRQYYYDGDGIAEKTGSNLVHDEGMLLATQRDPRPSRLKFLGARKFPENDNEESQLVDDGVILDFVQDPNYN